MNAITQDQAIQRAKNYRNAKAGFQQAIHWAVNQALNGNADGLYMIMRAAEMLRNSKGELFTCSDGRQLWKYWNAAEGGLGLKGIVTWNAKSAKFNMAAGWLEVAKGIDMAALHVALSVTRWDTFAKVKTEKAFDLDKAVARLLTQATKNGISVLKVMEKMQEAAISANPKNAPIPHIELPKVAELKVKEVPFIQTSGNWAAASVYGSA